jgi:glycosyltransferase involved in cell wall biosynthesis
MAKPLMKILQINTKDLGGGADHVAWSLHRGFRAEGHRSWIYVGRKRRDDPQVIQGDNDAYRTDWARTWVSVGNLLSPLEKRVPGMWRLRDFLTLGVGQPSRWLKILIGHEDFHFPATGHLLDLLPVKPDIIHCHNLHGGYFDLRALPWLSRQAPLVFTLHDAWLLSGHCGHSLGCERWKTGCGECPDLSIYPPVRRDGTAYNWRLKKGIYSECRLYMTVPCQWLISKVEQSILARAIRETKVIPHGIDLSVFKPADKRIVRELLNLPSKSKVVLFSAASIHGNPWRDTEAMRESIAKTATSCLKEDLFFLALGEDRPDEWIGPARVHFVPFQEGPLSVARFCQTSDVYVHPATEDTFPNTVLEALACGTPVIATAVGGIPEQILEGTSGFLVPPRDSEAISRAMTVLLTDDALRTRCSRSAAEDAGKRFDVKRMIGDYLHWYEEILNQVEQDQREYHALP